MLLRHQRIRSLSGWFQSCSISFQSCSSDAIDGPYVEAKEIIASFGVSQADDYDAAVAIARKCPPGHTIEIRELAGYA
jgi:hypothetical protein